MESLDLSTLCGWFKPPPTELHSGIYHNRTGLSGRICYPESPGKFTEFSNVRANEANKLLEPSHTQTGYNLKICGLNAILLISKDVPALLKPNTSCNEVFCHYTHRYTVEPPTKCSIITFANDTPVLLICCFRGSFLELFAPSPFSESRSSEADVSEHRGPDVATRQASNLPTCCQGDQAT